MLLLYSLHNPLGIPMIGEDPMFEWDENLALVVLGTVATLLGIWLKAGFSPAGSVWRRRTTKVAIGAIVYALVAGSTWYATWSPAEVTASANEVAQTFGLKSGAHNRISLGIADDVTAEAEEGIVKIDFDQPYTREGKLLLTFWHKGTPTVLEIKSNEHYLSIQQSPTAPATATFTFTGETGRDFGTHEVTSASDCKLVFWNLFPTCQRNITRKLRVNGEVARAGLSKVINLSQDGFDSDLMVTIVVHPAQFAKLKADRGTNGE